MVAGNGFDGEAQLIRQQRHRTDLPLGGHVDVDLADAAFGRTVDVRLYVCGTSRNRWEFRIPSSLVSYMLGKFKFSSNCRFAKQHRRRLH